MSTLEFTVFPASAIVRFRGFYFILDEVAVTSSIVTMWIGGVSGG